MKTLRELLQEKKAWYISKYGTIDWRWTDEGSAFVIGDYYGNVGSLSDFSEDDFVAANEEGWDRDEIEYLCCEEDSSED